MRGVGRGWFLMIDQPSTDAIMARLCQWGLWPVQVYPTSLVDGSEVVGSCYTAYAGEGYPPQGIDGASVQEAVWNLWKYVSRERSIDPLSGHDLKQRVSVLGAKAAPRSDISNQGAGR